MARLDLKFFKQTINELKENKDPFLEFESMKYLYSLYTQVVDNTEITLSDIDFEQFDLEELEEFEGYYDDVICHDGSVSYRLHEQIRKMPPIPVKAKFI